MNNSWNTNQFQQGLPSQAGQVKMFDPTQFQTPAAFGAAQQAGKSPQNQQQTQPPVQPEQNATSMQAAHSSWNSWGSWDWNSESKDTAAGAQQQHLDQQAQQQNPVISQHQQAPIGTSGGYQYYGGDSQYSTAWNPSWDGAGQYAQHQQGYAQPGGSEQFDQTQQQQQQQEELQQQQQPQQFGGMFDPSQYGNQSYQQQQYYGGQFYDHQHQQQPQQQPQQQTEEQAPAPQQFQGHEQYNMAQAFYDQPHDGNIWAGTSEAGQWGSSVQQPHQQPNTENVGAENSSEQQSHGDLHNANVENSSAQPSAHNLTSHDSEPVVMAPSLEVYNHDDDGTVSGFFGRDDDGDVHIPSQRHNQGGLRSDDQGAENVSAFNKFLAVDPSFHRTNSEISNASLSTLNLSNADDEDGMEPLHNVQDLVQRMEEVSLSQTAGQEPNVSMMSAGDGQVPGQPSTGASVLPSSGMGGEQGQRAGGDYSGFGNSVYDHTAAPPPTLPLDTNIRPSSPDGDHPGSAESGGSGGSGGSSGLADWEIVPPQMGQMTHSRNSSLDNSASFFSDKPDGGVNLSSGDGNTDGQGALPQGSQSQPFASMSEGSVHTNFQNIDPSKHSSPRESSSATSFHESSQAHRDSGRRSGSPFVAAVTDRTQEDAMPPSTQPPPKGLAPSGLSGAPPPSQPSGEGAANPFRRDGGKSPRHASIPQPTNPASSSNPPPLLPGGTRPGDDKLGNPRQSSETSRAKGMTALPSKPELPSRSSTEDGNRISRRDSDQSIKSTDSSPTKIKQGGDPPVRSNSRNSEEVALSTQRRHHSAFHPVSRPRQTAMSPATTLWDNSEAPTSNILLAPAMPLIIPGLNQHSTSTAATSMTDVLGKSGSSDVRKSDSTADRSRQKGSSRDADRREERDRGREERNKEDKNRSFDSLDELDAEVDGPKIRSSRGQRGDPRDSRDPDRPPSRYERPHSRGDRGAGQYHYERPLSRTEGYSREESYRRPRGSYRDYGDSSYDERYDRPRSRQDESRGSRPSSRSAQEVDRPRSRAEYDRDRDRDYYYRDRPRGYAYDSYGRHADYYNEERERYYRYYKDREARYTRGYYEEYYGAKHAEYYQQHQQQQQQLQQQQQYGRQSSQDIDRSSQSYSRGNTPAMTSSRGNTPAMASSRGNTPGIPSSRGNTPGIAPSPAVPPSPRPDYYNRGSRPSSRAEYARDYYSRGYVYDGYGAYYDGYGYDPYYGYSYPGYEDYSQAYDQGRLTPPKYSYPHVRASFGPNGQLVKVLPNRPTDGQPAIVELQDVQSVLDSCPEAEELKLFPGPLMRSTHKKDVLLFCQQKARACAEDINMMDRESAQLIWRFLELLIKQNGSVVGTDLADLLLEGHEPSTHEYSVHGMKISQSSDALDTVPEGSSEDNGSARESPAVRVTSDRTVISSADREREKWIDRFRHLLLYGRKKDALECAMKNNLWGHALFLASKMDARTHANVMTRFANSAMRMNDPLQTLYQLMSGRQPAAVTCVVDERWGDWRPHLAMILSNTTSRHDLDRKSISSLGDTLATKGYLHASHFCYLMAQVTFGNYNKKTSKIVLIGSSHYLPMEEFATNDAIQCTEVYEYAQVLGNAAFCLPYFQVYKYLYACRLADYGMASEALLYCEIIATNIQQYPTWFQSSFVKLVFQLASKMKFSDPQRQHASEDAEDPMWLQQLEKICTAYDDGTIQGLSGTATPAGFPGTTTSSESGDYNAYAYGYVGDTSNMSMMSTAGGTEAYGHQQQHVQQGTSDYYGGQDMSAVAGQTQAQDATGADQQYQQGQQQQGYDPQAQQQQQYDYSQWQQQYGYQYSGYGDQQLQHPQQQQQQQQQQQDSQQQNGEESVENQQYAAQHYQQQQQQQQQDHPEQPEEEDQQHSHDVPGPSLDSSASSAQMSANLHSQGYGNYGLVQGQQHQQMPPRASISTNETEDDDDDDNDEDDVDAPASGFDYFGDVGAQKVVVPPHRYRSMSGSSTGSTRRRRTTSGSSTGSVKAAPHKPAPQPPLGGGKDDKKAAQQGGGGWFGGFFKKLGGKGKNEMILPDDKNPAIVWDSSRKKWVNADGTEEEETPAAPPPKDTDLLGKKPTPGPSASMPPPPATAGGGNKFSLKAKGARNQYVDVNNPKPLAVPQDLFNVMPGPTADGGTSAALPQMFMPGSTGNTSTNNTNDSNINNASLSVPSGGEGPAADNSNASVPAAAPVQQAPSGPMLFNPASLSSGRTGAGQAHTAAGPGLKYGQRRAYPK